ncbi:MAG: molybdate ABC transporter substrate-binding protein [Flavobacteriaceae bacterium]|nr:MAG: molybdate ABC transporter substrate-binding protein [Flavobacteriaceae bacterium]
MIQKVFKNIRMFFLVVVACSCTVETSRNLTIATASNMKTTMVALQKEYQKQTGTSIDLVVASSGKLTAQIRAGAPFDIFVSADLKYPESLFTDGITISKPEIYAYGTLILWTCKEGLTPEITTLSLPYTTHIGIANPKTAPYGKAAIKVLEYYHLKNKLDEKLVYGESVSQTNQFIQTQHVDLGFTSKSVLFSPYLTRKGSWSAIDRASYPPIKQGIVLLKNGKEKSARKFYHFLTSDKGQLILENYGYLIQNLHKDE